MKEYYFYLDSTPTHSYMKYLYKYPQAAFPYDDLVATNRRRSREEMEYELLDTGVFDDDRYFDVFVEYAKAGPEDSWSRSRCQPWPRSGPVCTLADALVPEHLGWSRGAATGPCCGNRPQAVQGAAGHRARSPRIRLGECLLYCEGDAPLLFTENETNNAAALRDSQTHAPCEGRDQRLCRSGQAGCGESRQGRAPRPPRTTSCTIGPGEEPG